jgi:anti-anti-sigma factor
MPATVSTSGNVARIDLSGEFDFSTQDHLKQVFDKALNTSASEIYIDMKNTLFIDSSVIRSLLKLHEIAKQYKKSLTIVNCNERIFEILTIGGFDQIFDIR